MRNDNTIKEEIKQRYGKIALTGNLDSCCMPSSECCSTEGYDVDSQINSAKVIGYNSEELAAIPSSSILGVGCGNPTKFAHINEGDIVVDLGSGAGIDVFLAANIIKDKGRVIGIDMTEEMLEKAKGNAKQHGYKNVEFRQGDIEKRIPVDDNSVDVVISNCVINLTADKVNTFKEIYRILKPNGNGSMVISDLVTEKEVNADSINAESWCSCIDGALTKENYIDSIRKAGFNDIEVLDEKPYLEMESEDKRKITSLAIKAIK
ncbi:MAG: arsenite methyltransferase [Thermoproteota archaeon]|nr:arsenite methyltransferase [Thermoproteota archaeon]